MLVVSSLCNVIPVPVARVGRRWRSDAGHGTPDSHRPGAGMPAGRDDASSDEGARPRALRPSRILSSSAAAPSSGIH